MRLELHGADHPGRSSLKGLGGFGGLIDDVLTKVPAVGVVTSIFGTDKPTDAVWTRTRNKIFEMFNAVGIDQDDRNSPLHKAAIANKMTHDDVPKKKNKGESYNPEFQRLYKMVVDTFIGMGRKDFADYFVWNVPPYTTTVHPIDIIAQMLTASVLPSTGVNTGTSATNDNVTNTGEASGNNVPKKKDNTGLIIGIAAGTLVAGGIVAAFVSSKKRQGMGRVPVRRKSARKKTRKARRK